MYMYIWMASPIKNWATVKFGGGVVRGGGAGGCPSLYLLDSCQVFLVSVDLLFQGGVPASQVCQLNLEGSHFVVQLHLCVVKRQQMDKHSCTLNVKMDVESTLPGYVM